jgi:transcription elongation factor Elf1
MIDKKAYIRSRGLVCPFCKAESVQGGFIQVEAGKAIQDMSCLECENRWQDVYQLVDVIPEEKGE